MYVLSSGLAIDRYLKIHISKKLDLFLLEDFFSQ